MGRRKEGIELIASLLRGYHLGLDSSMAHDGAMAVRASIAEGIGRGQNRFWKWPKQTSHLLEKEVKLSAK